MKKIITFRDEKKIHFYYDLNNGRQQRETLAQALLIYSDEIFHR